MSRVEKLSNYIASKIAGNLSIDSDHEEVLAYGAFALIQTIYTIIVLAIFGAVFGVVVEALVISFSAAILRKFSGGAHASTPMSCALSGMIIFGGLALLVKHFIVNIDFKYLAVLMIIAFAFVLYMMYKYSPVGSANKPLKNQEKRRRLKRQSIVFVTYLLILNIILITLYMKTRNSFLLSIATCITAGIIWQSITLVSLGQLFIDTLDKLLGGTNKYLRRGNK